MKKKCQIFETSISWYCNEGWPIDNRILDRDYGKKSCTNAVNYGISNVINSNQ